MTELAPVEYMIIDFPGSRFTGEIVPALVELVDSGVVRILDLVFVMKDDDGTVTSLEFDQLDEIGDFDALEGDAGDLLSTDDVLELAEEVSAGSSALLIVWEDLWAAPLGRAVRNAGGQLVAGGRIPHQVLSDIFTDSQEVES